jgi:hypothetical protein
MTRSDEEGIRHTSRKRHMDSGTKTIKQENID